MDVRRSGGSRALPFVGRAEYDGPDELRIPDARARAVLKDFKCPTVTEKFMVR